MKKLLKIITLLFIVFLSSFTLTIYAKTVFIAYDDNNPPNPPDIDGETNCKLRQEYVYNITITDPDGTRMTELFVMFGDGTNITLEYHGSSCHKGWRSGMMLDVRHAWKHPMITQ